MQLTSVFRFPWRLVAGAAVALVGSTWAVIALRGPQIALPPGASSGSPVSPLTRAVSLPRDFASVSQEQADSVRTNVEVEARKALGGKDFSPVSADSSRAAAAEIAEVASVILAPEYERYLKYCRDRGEVKPFVLTLPESQRAESFRKQCTSFAGQPLREGNSIARWRIRAGQEIVVKDIEPISITSSHGMGVTSASPSEGVDAIEYVFPTVAKTPAGEAIACRLGIWVGKTRSDPRWKMLRLMIYDVPPVGKPVIPPPF